MPRCRRASRPKAGEIAHWLKKNWLMLATLAGVILGLLLGIVLHEYKVSTRTAELVAFPGILLIRGLYMIVGPLILCGVVSGISGVADLKLGKAGGQLIAYYLLTTCVAAIIGVSLGALMKPGAGIHGGSENVTEPEAYTDTADVVLDLVRNMVPDNIVRAMMKSERTMYKFENAAVVSLQVQMGNNATANDSAESIPTRYILYEDSVNFMGIIVFGIVFGVALRQVGQEGNILQMCAKELNDVFMRIVLYMIYYSPIGALFLVAGSIASVKNLEEIGGKLALLTTATILGVLAHASILTMIYFIFVRKNPFHFIAGLKETLTIAFATRSSMAALPTTIRCVQDLGVNRGITRLVLPIGATVNMDGGAMHLSLIALYTAQLYGVRLGIGQIIKVALCSSFASIGAAAIPNSLFAALVITLKAVDLPTRDIGLLFATEWLLDRVKTPLNVYGDCVGASLVNLWQGKQTERNLEENATACNKHDSAKSEGRVEEATLV